MFLKKVGHSPIKPLIQDYEEKMCDLAKLLIAVRLGEEKISAEYLDVDESG